MRWRRNLEEVAKAVFFYHALDRLSIDACILGHATHMSMMTLEEVQQKLTFE